MGLHDFDKARATHDALLGILVSEPGGASNPNALRRVSSLCDIAAGALNDVEAKAAMRSIKSMALLVYTDASHEEVTAGSLRGLDALRFRMMSALGTYLGRVHLLERRPPSVPEVPLVIRNRSLRVLVVEDNRDSAEMMRALVELGGFEVTVVSTSMDAVDTARRIQPDVIFCDIGLPDTDGFALAETLRADPVTSGARLIAVTAYGRPRDLVRSTQAGFDLHLVKPVAPAKILQVLEDVAAEKRGEPAPPVVHLSERRKPKDL